MTDEQRNAPTAPAFRHMGIGSMVTRHCWGCDKHKTTTGGSGAGLRWRCVGCAPKKVTA